MGEHRVHDTSDEQRTRAFERAMLDDLRALEIMIERDLIERDVRRVGVEQEMYIVDADGFPAPLSERVIEQLGDARFTTELARFNLEANLDPWPIGGDFLQSMERGLGQVFRRAAQAATALGARIVLTGILPTLDERHISHSNLTPEVRYHCLNDSCMAARGDTFTLEIDGVDRFEFRHDCAVLEGANTSFQFHLQVAPEEAAPLYNLAQLITAPLLAAAANSPVVLNRRVWHETRVALFERVFEYRSASQLARNFPTRVGFGEGWVRDSIIEIFRDNAMRYHVIMIRDPVEDSLQALDEGRIPELSALTLHNGTVWRWNRPCYGITNGKPHLRIENRALPSGPTIVDQVANAALFYGLMQSFAGDAASVPERIEFEQAKVNFLACAQHGLDARLTWLDGRRVGARTLLQETLIPAARAGLASLEAPADDVQRIMDIMESRVSSGQTGARWLLDSLAVAKEGQRKAICRHAVELMCERQCGPVPVHEWNLVSAQDGKTVKTTIKLGDIMTTDLFTVRPDDIVDLATSTMEWRHVRHVPVENANGEIVGLLSTRELLRLRSRQPGDRDQPVPVSAIMQRNPPTLSPNTPLAEVFEHLLNGDNGCVLVAARGQLLGIVTERDLLRVAHALLRQGP